MALHHANRTRARRSAVWHFPHSLQPDAGMPKLRRHMAARILEPIHSWDETFTETGSLVTVNSPNNNIQNNRDYYYQVGGAQTSPTSPFNGTTGTGYGTAANRPTTCTAGPGGTGEQALRDRTAWLISLPMPIAA